MLKLFYMTGACSLASHFALEEAGAEYEAILVNLMQGEQRKPEYLAMNPLGRVPMLVTDKGSITENPAILAYIAQAYPAAKLAPTDPFAFAQVQSFNGFLSSTLHVAFSHFNRPGRYAEGDEAAAAMKAKVPGDLDDFFGIVEAKLADGREWVHGDFSISDCYLAVFAMWQARLKLADEAKIPNVLAHRDRVLARPASRKVLADEGLA